MKILGTLMIFAAIALDIISQVKYFQGDDTAFICLNSALILFVLGLILLKQPRDNYDEQGKN